VVAVDADSSYRYLGAGSPMAIEVIGPSAEACIACAVEGFTAAFADVHPSVVPVPRAFSAQGDDPSALLRGVLDASIGLTADGNLAVSAAEVRVDGAQVDGHFETVPAAWAAVSVSLPVAVSWHDLSLERVNGHWLGRIVADLAFRALGTETT
jgi:SHS2 domain-containing protein